MALSVGIFGAQDRDEDDLTSGPAGDPTGGGPSWYEGASAIPKAVQAGGMDVYAALMGGLHAPVKYREETNGQYDLGLGIEEMEQAAATPDVAAQEQADLARETAKSLQPDPRVTGSAVNAVSGFVRGATVFGLGTAFGGPEAGAQLLAATTGYRTYHDMKDEGVDDNTAMAMATVDAAAAYAGVKMPMSLPENWLARMSGAAAFSTQLAAGGAINTGFGVASRYASSELLRANGYGAMADQTQPFDETNMASDFLLGSLFGAHAGAHELIADRKVDSSVTDAARATQDRQATIDRAPGIPTSQDAAGAHLRTLQAAEESLLKGEPAAMDPDDVDQLQFISRPQTEEQQTVVQILHQEGVFDSAAALDHAEGELVKRQGRGSLEAFNPPEEREEPISRSPEATERAPVTTQRGAAPDERRDSLLEYMARHSEGINTQEAVSEGFDKADLDSAKVGIKRAFRANGQSMDHAAETLAQAGYPVKDSQGRFDKNMLVDAIGRELHGKKVYSSANETLATDLLARHEEEQRGMEEARAALAKEPEVGPDDVELTHWMRMADEGVAERASIQWDNANAAERRAIIERLKESADAERSKNAGDQQGAAQALELKGETAGEIKDRGEREAQSEAAQAAAEKLAESHAAADRAAKEPLALTGSDRPADANPNQADIFAERPDLQVATDQGPELASKALEDTTAEAAQVSAEAPKMMSAAADCGARFGF